jgi:hypothetical protein
MGRLHLGHETDVVDPLPVTLAVDGRSVAPRVLQHRWTPDGTTTLYDLGSVRATERKGVRGAVLCADWSFEGSGRVEVRAVAPERLRAKVTTISLFEGLEADLSVRSTPLAPVDAPGRLSLRCAIGGGEPAGSLDDAPFEDWLAAHAPRLTCESDDLASVYEYRWFVVYRNLRRPARWFAGHPMPGELFFEGPVSSWFSAPIGLSFPLQLREARWMRSPRGVEDTLRAWAENKGALRSYAADPVSPAVELAEHHPLDLREVLEAARAYLRGEGRSPRLPLDGEFPLTLGSWVTGTEYAPDFFAEVGWDHRRSEMWMAPPTLPRAGERDSREIRRLTRLRRVDTDVWHWAMTRAAGGPDLRDAFAQLHLHDGVFRSVGSRPIAEVLGFEAALPFLLDDFGPRERAALAAAVDAWTAPHGLMSTAPDCPAFSAENRWEAGPAAPYDYPCCWNGPCWSYATSWVLHALGAVAGRTGEAPLRERFARTWRVWTDSHLTLGFPMVAEHYHPFTGRPYRLIPDYFHSAWLDTFFRHVAGIGAPPLVDAGPLRVEGVPLRGELVDVERH